MCPFPLVELLEAQQLRHQPLPLQAEEVQEVLSFLGRQPQIQPLNHPSLPHNLAPAFKSESTVEKQ